VTAPGPASSVVVSHHTAVRSRVFGFRPSLDGGGAKGFYTLGALKEIEGMLGCPLYKRFDLIFGTSTGSIIGALLAIGCEIDQIHDLYRKHVVSIMAHKSAAAKTAALAKLASEVFGDLKFANQSKQ
jgi:patatin-like phospholipase/acyl hydrolase